MQEQVVRISRSASQRRVGRSVALRILGVTATLLISHAAQAQGTVTTCGDLKNGVGPFDFRVDKEKMTVVTGAHFTPVVEALIRSSTGYLGGDIDYTLRAIPNHPNALMAMMRLAEREKRDKANFANYTVECYFERAIRFRPDDVMVRMIFTSYLAKKDRKPEAMKQLEIALPMAKDNPFTQYNIGMLYFDLKEYKLALAQAHKATELGLTWTELREKLTAAGQWSDPVGAPADAASGSASAPAKP